MNKGLHVNGVQPFDVAALRPLSGAVLHAALKERAGGARAELLNAFDDDSWRHSACRAHGDQSIATARPL